MPTVDIERLRSIKTFPSLVKYLRDELDWPIDTDAVEDLTFEYQPEELGLDAKHAAKIKEIKQLRPLDSKQPWGIFWVNFEKKRLPMVVLRRILGSLVVKKRASANKIDRPNWQLNDLLFISSYGEEEHRTISFAHFTEDPSTDELPVLRILGWDDQNSIMHLDRVAGRLETHFRWPSNPAELETWRRRWTEGFTDRYREAIRSADVLIPELARLARAIRKRVRDTLDAENERGPMRKLLAAVRGLLIHDMDGDAFADMYAQTVAYGLLSARFSRPAGLTAQNLVQLTSVSNPFLENLLENLFRLNRGKFHFDVDEVGINDVLDLLRKTNIDAIKAAFNDENPAEDPVIRFYEGFLKEYDPKQRIQRGIFFTPRPVVSYIVRSVHELLQTEFGLEHGLASTATWAEMLKNFPNLQLPQDVNPDDPFVCILDPATGTGTFLFTCIEVIERTMKDKWCRELDKKSWHDPEVLTRWRNYVPRYLLPRLYGYELMMAPYAIAHLKLALKLGETGYQFRDGDRLHIYLTNSLEPPSDVADPKLADLFATLAKEAQEVNDIKRQKHFTVVIGNPPYSIQSQNLTETARAWVDPYRCVDGQPIKEKGALQFEKSLQDDCVKFASFSQHQIQKSSIGMLGMIMSHSFIDNPTLRGMRQSLGQTFARIFVYDLHGNSTRKERSPDGSEDKNVFDIKQGVGILVAARPSAENIFAVLQHADAWGTRETKYETLLRTSVSTSGFVSVTLVSPFYLFKPQVAATREEYGQGWTITDIFITGNVGIITARDNMVIDYEAAPLVERAEVFRDSQLSDEKLCEGLEISLKKGWDIGRARDAIKKDKDLRKYVKPLTYRPFDNRLVFYHPSVVWGMSNPTMQHMLPGGNLAMTVGRAGQVIGQGEWDIIYSTRNLTEFNLYRRGGHNLLPLYLIPDEEDPQTGLSGHNAWRLNFTPNFLSAIASRLGLSRTGNFGVPRSLTPEEIFHYAYAVFHSPTYRSRYAEFLKIDFPRLPLTSSLELFRVLARLGGELVALHLLESPKLDKHITEFVGGNNPEVEKVSWAKKTVWIDKAQTAGFKGVSEDVWNFYIGGYQVCEKWLKDRKGRTLTKDDIAHYHKIVVALSETIRLMKVIDEVIDKHGGWPGAFASTSYKESPETEMPLAAESSAFYRKGGSGSE